MEWQDNVDQVHHLSKAELEDVVSAALALLLQRASSADASLMQQYARLFAVWESVKQ